MASIPRTPGPANHRCEGLTIMHEFSLHCTFLNYIHGLFYRSLTVSICTCLFFPTYLLCIFNKPVSNQVSLCTHIRFLSLTFSRQPWGQKLPRSDVWAPYLTQVPTLSSVRFAARFVRWGDCWKHWTVIGPFKTQKSLLKLLCLQFHYILVPSCPDPSLWPQPGKILHFSAFRFGSPGHV